VIEPADGLRWVSFDAGHAIAVQGGVLITIWSGEMRAAAVRQAATESRRLTDARPGALSFLNMIVRGTPVPGEDVRAEFQKMIRQGPGALRCTAIVAEGGGFHGSAVRAVVTGITMVVRPKFPMKVHASVAEAAAWIAAQAGPAGATAAEISAAVDAMRARLAAGV
jgi:hypothetical protein